MKTILVTSQKGGSGKTTLVANLSVEAARTGAVVLVDTDPQGTLTQWVQRRPVDSPVLVKAEISQLKIGLGSIKDSTRFVFIDSPPTIGSVIDVLVDIADLVLIPVKPSPADLWSVAKTVQLVKEKKKNFLFVLNQVKANSAITAQAAAALSKFGPVASSFIGDRTIFASSLTSGNVASEISSKSPASMEVIKVWKEVEEFLL